MVMIKIREILNAEKPLLRIYSVERLEYLELFYFFFVAITEVYKNEGNDEYNKKNFNSAIYFYTEGIKVNCKDEELNAKLYSNRAAAHFNLGKKLFIAELSRARSARSGAPWVRKFGKLSIRENMVMT